jgi:hypothetical protein
MSIPASWRTRLLRCGVLADFLTMHEASGKPYDAIGYAFAGDCRFNMGRLQDARAS